MARPGDQKLVIQVTKVDIDKAEVKNDYKTSLGLAVIRTLNLQPGDVSFSIAGYKMAIAGYVYNLDAQSIAYCNIEEAGVKLTQPYIAQLDYADLI